MSNLESLPDECLESIFKFLNKPHHLDTLSLVSTHFLSVTNSIVTSLKISGNTQSLPFLPRLLTRFPNLRSLDLWHFNGDLYALLLQLSQSPSSKSSLNVRIGDSFPADGFRTLAQKIQSLKSLTLSNGESAPFTNADILHVLQFFPLLEELELDLHFSCYSDSNNNPDDAAAAAVAVVGGPVSDTDVEEALPLALPKLRKVKLRGDYLINDSMLFNLCKNCHALEHVEVDGSGMISQPGIAGAFKERPNLTSFMFLDATGSDISSVFIDSLVGLKQLTCLYMEAVISDELDTLLLSVATAGLPLRKLSLSKCEGYSYNGISLLLSKCRHIQHLDLSFGAEFLEDKHIKELSKFLGNLMFINLSCHRLSYLSCILLTVFCPLLNEINMDGTFEDFDNKEALDFDTIVNFRVKSIRLLYYNEGLMDANVERLALLCPNLEVLELSFCSLMSNAAFEVLKICPKIRYLRLYSLPNVDLVGMKNFQFPNLEVLRLSFSKVDDNALFVLSQSCPGLVDLDMRGCSDITAKAVKHVVKRCKQLRKIDLTSCGRVHPSVVALLRG